MSKSRPNSFVPQSFNRKVRTFSARIKYIKSDNKWIIAPGQVSMDTKINDWVAAENTYIVSVDVSFNDYLVSEDVLYTDYLYVVVYSPTALPAGMQILPTRSHQTTQTINFKDVAKEPKRETGDFVGLDATIER